MISQIVVSIAVVTCIAFATPTPVTPSGNQAQCLQTTDENDQFLYKSFESLHQWVNNKLSAKEDQVLSLIKNLESSMQSSKQEIVQTFTKYQETVEAKKAELENKINELEKAIKADREDLSQRFSRLEESIKGNVDGVQNSLSELKGQLSEFSNVGQQINGVREQIRGELQGQIGRIDQQAAVIQDVNNRVSQCVTDIKVSGRETSAIWRGPGYSDEGNKGYVLTGVSNFNVDQYPDNAHRRMILFHKNNAWTPLHE